MSHIQRILDIELPPGKSAFLWGARRVGKTTYLRHRFPDALWYDLLQTDLALELTTRPELLREQTLALAQPESDRVVILDEVQKVPRLLDEVHWLIENNGTQFILCGSSARKLKRGAANLLGGRAWRFEMRPLTTAELPDFQLLRALNHGLIPDHYLEDDPSRSLRAYVGDYLQQEVFAEGLTRNVPAFARFFDAMAYSHGELINFSNISRDCGVSAKTVREYFQILADTLLGRFVEPFSHRGSRQVITRAPKFYLFDVGVAGTICRRHITEERGEDFGHALEHLVFMELVAYRAYRELDHPVRFWKTKAGHEVDFVLGDAEIAIEVKGTDRVDRSHMRGLKAFMKQHQPAHAIIVCNEKRERVSDGVRVLPWRSFFDKLWDGQLIQ